MAEKRPPRKNGPSRKRYKDAATQTDDEETCCPVQVPEICNLCHNRVLSVSSPNEISLEDNLPGNICQCFFWDNTDVPGAANFNVLEEQQNTGLPNVQVGDSLNANLHPIKEPHTEVSNSTSKNGTSSSEEPKLMEISLSSNGYASSPSDFSCNSRLSRLRRETPKSCSPNAEKSSSSNDQNLSDNQNIASEKLENNGLNTEKDGSSGYPLSAGEQSSDDRKKSNSPSSGEDYKNIENVKSSKSLFENVEQPNISESTFKKFSLNDRGENDQMQREYDYQHQLNVNRNSNMLYERNIPPEFPKFRSENPRPVLPPPFYPPYPQYYPQTTSPYQTHNNPAMNMSVIRFSLPHPQRHAQPIQPCGNPEMNTSMSRLSLPHSQNHEQTSQQYGYPSINMSLNRTYIDGRFPVPRPLMSSTPYRRRQNDGRNTNLSMKLLLDDAEEDPENRSVTAIKRVEDWILNLPDLTSEASASGCASGWSTAENEENEGVPPRLSEIFEDLDSTEISEEENLQQRSLKRPPRKHKK